MSGDPTEIVANMQRAWSAAFDARDGTAIVNLYADDALFLGSSPDLCVGRVAMRAYFDALPASIQLVDFPAMTVRAPAPNLIVASGDWSFTLGERRLDFRLTWALVERGDGWTIVQHHAGWRPAAAL